MSGMNLVNLHADAAVHAIVASLMSGARNIKMDPDHHAGLAGSASCSSSSPSSNSSTLSSVAMANAAQTQANETPIYVNSKLRQCQFCTKTVASNRASEHVKRCTKNPNRLPRRPDTKEQKLRNAEKKRLKWRNMTPQEKWTQWEKEKTRRLRKRIEKKGGAATPTPPPSSSAGATAPNLWPLNLMSSAVPVKLEQLEVGAVPQQQHHQHQVMLAHRQPQQHHVVHPHLQHLQLHPQHQHHQQHH